MESQKYKAVEHCAFVKVRLVDSLSVHTACPICGITPKCGVFMHVGVAASVGGDDSRGMCLPKTVPETEARWLLGL